MEGGDISFSSFSSVEDGYVGDGGITSGSSEKAPPPSSSSSPDPALMNYQILSTLHPLLNAHSQDLFAQSKAPQISLST